MSIFTISSCPPNDAAMSGVQRFCVDNDSYILNMDDVVIVHKKYCNRVLESLGAYFTFQFLLWCSDKVCMFRYTVIM